MLSASVDNQPPRGEGGRLLLISSDRGDRRIFWGLKFPISGLFWVRIFCKYFLGVDWFKKGFWGIFKTIWRFLIVPAYLGRVVPVELIFMARKFGMEFIWSKSHNTDNSPIMALVWSYVLFQGFFFFEALGIYFLGRGGGGDFCPHSIIPVTWIRRTPREPTLLNLHNPADDILTHLTYNNYC